MLLHFAAMGRILQSIESTKLMHVKCNQSLIPMEWDDILFSQRWQIVQIVATLLLYFEWFLVLFWLVFLFVSFLLEEFQLACWNAQFSCLVVNETSFSWTCTQISVTHKSPLAQIVRRRDLARLGCRWPCQFFLVHLDLFFFSILFNFLFASLHVFVLL